MHSPKSVCVQKLRALEMSSASQQTRNTTRVVCDLGLYHSNAVDTFRKISLLNCVPGLYNLSIDSIHIDIIYRGYWHNFRITILKRLEYMHETLIIF